MQRELLEKYGQAVGYLPLRLRGEAMKLSDAEKISATEFRLRAGRIMSVRIGEEEKCIGECPVRHEELEYTLELATRSSVHVAAASIREGYVTLSGGHRLGLCGTVAGGEGGIWTIRDLSSVCIRIAKPIYTAAEKVYPQILRGGRYRNTIIISPPGHGKTTMLRDLVRRLSDGGLRISLVDERGEVAAKRRGLPRFDVGKCTDVMDGVRKAEGAMLMLRTMSPDIIALDEITASEDMQAISAIINCGVGILATVHGESEEDVFSRPPFRTLNSMQVFRNILVLKKENGAFTYRLQETEKRI